MDSVDSGRTNEKIMFYSLYCFFCLPRKCFFLKKVADSAENQFSLHGGRHFGITQGYFFCMLRFTTMLSEWPKVKIGVVF